MLNVDLLDIGLNSESINYEVALEIIGQDRQPFMRTIAEENKKAAPSQVLIDYCKARLAAIDELQESLLPTDLTAIRMILTNDPVFLRKRQES